MDETNIIKKEAVKLVRKRLMELLTPQVSPLFSANHLLEPESFLRVLAEHPVPWRKGVL